MAIANANSRFVPVPVSPLLLADRLLTLAQDADRAGYAGAASHMVTAMFAVLEGRSGLGGQPKRQARQLRRPNQGTGRAAEAKADLGR